MYRDRDFNLAQELPPASEDLIQDLGLAILFDAMADGDAFLLAVAKRAVLSSLSGIPTVLYRQEILSDCLANPRVVRDLYNLAVETIERERKTYWHVSSNNPGFLLHTSINVLHMLVEALRQLRKAAEAHAGKFRSDGFTTLFAMLQRELDEAYLGVVEAHLARLKFRRGVLISGRLGKGNAGGGYLLRRPNEDDRHWARRVFTKRPPAYTFHVHPRDENGGRALGELTNRGINFVANAVAQSSDHILSFFQMVRVELAFYVGCLNLHQKLSAKAEPTCFPVPAPCAERRYAVHNLYDICLALSLNRRVVTNNVAADGKDLLMITGANQGGKSTFLRSVGLAQLMMQCGMFVPARSFSANLCTGIFTHFKREEDATMRRGKLEEELQRASDIVDHLAPDCMTLFNESFQSTNEREGSEIGRQIVDALRESRVKVFFVTHMYDLARTLYEQRSANAAFLRADRREDGTRTFKIVAGAPLATSHGKDVFDEVFRAQAANLPCRGKEPHGSSRDVHRLEPHRQHATGSDVAKAANGNRDRERPLATS